MRVCVCLCDSEIHSDSRLCVFMCSASYRVAKTHGALRPSLVLNEFAGIPVFSQEYRQFSQ